ncbi:hypothetical protein B0H65DRAFT_116386 [Neurospora tetraspora]|uniref:Uncharacterized protein n=1 Tax=Neurospora tetraspora TaxID=94610 RepID=A0AAE0MUW4_9PEZI|nr:hypothetical protein B0H65DRAFT_116386 [Neurospora tetraspora]
MVRRKFVGFALVHPHRVFGAILTAILYSDGYGKHFRSRLDTDKQMSDSDAFYSALISSRIIYEQQVKEPLQVNGELVIGFQHLCHSVGLHFRGTQKEAEGRWRDRQRPTALAEHYCLCGWTSPLPRPPLSVDDFTIRYGGPLKGSERGANIGEPASVSIGAAIPAPEGGRRRRRNRHLFQALQFGTIQSV